MKSSHEFLYECDIGEMKRICSGRTNEGCQRWKAWKMGILVTLEPYDKPLSPYKYVSW
jgi:hypothetical protein